MPKTKPQHYVVMEIADEYNDEIYTLLDGGTPIAVYINEADAIAERNRLQYEKLKGCDVTSYAYDVEDLTRDPEDGWNSRGKSAEEIQEALPFCNFTGDYEWIVPATLTTEQLAQVDAMFKGLSFFKVVGV